MIQLTPLESVNEKIGDLTQLVFGHLRDFLKIYGISLNTVKVLVHPADPRMKALIALKAFGLTEKEAVRYYTAMLMAEKGIISAPNMAVGLPFNVGVFFPGMGIEATMPPAGKTPPSVEPAP